MLSHSTEPIKKSKSAVSESFRFGKHDVWVRRSDRKATIGLDVQIDGRVRVTSPKFVKLDDIKKLVAKNEDWIERGLEAYASVRKQYPPKKYVEGERFRFLGKDLELLYMRGKEPKVRFSICDHQLIGFIPAKQWPTFNPHVPHREFSSVVRTLYVEVAKEILTERLAIYEKKMDLHPTKVRFGAQKTRWGSCTWKGVISLNCRLIVTPIEVIDYIVVHELAHLRFYNHSVGFWEQVAKVLPDYQERSDKLRSQQYVADFLNRRSELHAP